MIVACGWCMKILDPGQGRAEPGETVSHGVCAKCYRAIMKEIVRLGHIGQAEADRSVRKIQRVEIRRQRRLRAAP